MREKLSPEAIAAGWALGAVARVPDYAESGHSWTTVEEDDAGHATLLRCSVCGKEFVSHANHPPKCCSPECNREYKHQYFARYWAEHKDIQKLE